MYEIMRNLILFLIAMTCKVLESTEPLITKTNQEFVKKPDLKYDKIKKNIHDKNKKIVFYLIRHAPSWTNISTSKNTIARKFWRLFRARKADSALHGIAKHRIDKTKTLLQNNNILQRPDAIFCSCLARAQGTAFLLFKDLSKIKNEKIEIYVAPYLREYKDFPRSNFPPKQKHWSRFLDSHYSIAKQKKESSYELNYTYVEDKKNKDLFTKEAMESDINKFFIFFEKNLNKFINIHSTQKTFCACAIAHSKVIKKFCKSRGKNIHVNNLGIIKIVLTYNTKTKKISYTKPVKIFDGYNLSHLK